MTGSQRQDWPTLAQYDAAVRNWKQSIQDREVRRSRPQLDRNGFLIRPGGANNYVCVYRFGKWMVRCFRANPPRHLPPDDIRERYRAIAAFLARRPQPTSALLPITYLEDGIVVDGLPFPIVRMPYLEEAMPLGTFVATSHTSSDWMQRLGEAWFRMTDALETAGVAHGDLDLTNVWVVRRWRKLELYLIDYDNMWLASLSGRTQTEGGHEPFQHPDFWPARRPFDQTMDRFSALVIYISLRALARFPHLFAQWQADDTYQLLFGPQDYRAFDLERGRIIQLRRLCERQDPQLLPFIDELRDCLYFHRMPRRLAEVARSGTLLPIAPAPSSRPLPLLREGSQIHGEPGPSGPSGQTAPPGQPSSQA